MISTHNHVDMAASLVGAGPVRGDATAAHPGKQLGHRQASSRSRIDGRACAPARGDPGTPRPARRSGLARQPTTSAPVGAEPFRATPSQPSPTTAPSTTPEEDPAGGNRPDATTATPTGGVWRGRAAFALLGWGNNASMAVPMRNGRRRAAGAGPMVRAFGDTRTCAEDGCTAQLSRYNPARRCAIHQGWDRQVVTRPRRKLSTPVRQVDQGFVVPSVSSGWLIHATVGSAGGAGGLWTNRSGWAA